jgi:DNA polymerase I-like protein with 3'-5' exonuclease and polymerase domains
MEKDLHSVTQMLLEDAGVEKVSRSEAKTLNFAMLYGAPKGYFKSRLAQKQKDVILKLAEKVIKAKLKRYKGYPCICGQVIEKHDKYKCGQKGMGFYCPMNNLDYLKWLKNKNHRGHLAQIRDI